MTIEEQITMRAIQNINRKMPEITLRDLFAMSVLQTVVKDYPYVQLRDIAEQSYRVADAMLEARKK